MPSNYRPMSAKERKIEEWRLRNGLPAATPKGEIVQPAAPEATVCQLAEKLGEHKDSAAA